MQRLKWSYIEVLVLLDDADRHFDDDINPEFGMTVSFHVSALLFLHIS